MNDESLVLNPSVPLFPVSACTAPDGIAGKAGSYSARPRPRPTPKPL